MTDQEKYEKAQQKAQLDSKIQLRIDLEQETLYKRETSGRHRMSSGKKKIIALAVFMVVLFVISLTLVPYGALSGLLNSLTDGLEKLLHPLNKLHVPVHEISMMMSIALRFIPILLEETDKIMKAQIARGADMESGNLIQKAKAMIPILVPLFVSAFRRANDLAMAMEARCYRGGNGRTKMKPLIYKSADHMAYLITILYVVIAFVVGRYVPFKLWIF